MTSPASHAPPAAQPSSRARMWFEAARPKTLPVAVAPVLLGAAIARVEGGFDLLPALAALFGALFIQIGTNFANDYFDAKKGADTEERLGPVRATAAGLVSPEAMKRAFILAFLAVLPFGAYLVWHAGWPLVAIGAASIVSGILYTGGPYPLAYLGIADVFVLVFFGPVAVAGTHFVQTLQFSRTAAIAGLFPGLLSMAILAVNNLRDVDTDKKANKKTPAVRFGPGFAKAEYVVCITLASAVVVLGSLGAGAFLHLAALGGMVLSAPLIRAVFTVRGRPLNAVLGGTGRLLFVTTALWTVAIVLSGKAPVFGL